MFDAASYFSGLAVMAALALPAWVYSVLRRNVTLVDSLWSLFFCAACLVYVQAAPGSDRATLMLALTLVWGLRLSAYLTWRNWGKPEDTRYQQIRQNNEPGFGFKSLYLIFGLQVVLAWIISLPQHAAVFSAAPLNVLDYAGFTLWLFGWGWETAADSQLARFKANPANHGKVMNRGLWRYSRHPNYFGECCLWWGFYLVALAGGGWWSVVSPLLMTFLLLKISGVPMLEQGMLQRNPEYAAYVRSTNAFLPWKPKHGEPAR